MYSAEKTKGIYRIKNSPYWWYSFKLPGRKRVQKSTLTADKELAQQIYYAKRSECLRADYSFTRTKRGPRNVQVPQSVEGPLTPLERLQQWRENEGKALAAKARTQQRKRKICEAYGGRCACCGEHRIEFLSVDHINGDGAKHRRELGGGRLYCWLILNNFPKENFQLLCMNCNFAKGRFNECPHKRELEPEILKVG